MPRHASIPPLRPPHPAARRIGRRAAPRRPGAGTARPRRHRLGREGALRARRAHRRLRRQGGDEGSVGRADRRRRSAGREAGPGRRVSRRGLCRRRRQGGRPARPGVRLEAARHRDGQRRGDEDQTVPRLGAGQSAPGGHGGEAAQERRRLVLRPVARRSLPRMDGVGPPGASSPSNRRTLSRRSRASWSRPCSRSSGNTPRPTPRRSPISSSATFWRRPAGRGAWTSVRMADGRTGFVSGADATATGPGRRRATSRPRTPSRRPAVSWACPTCGAAPPPGGSTAPASSRPCSG